MFSARRDNGDLIILKTNTGRIIPLKRIWGRDVVYEGDNLGVNYRKWEFGGWIEIDKSLGIDKHIFDDAPISILFKAKNGNIAKYVYCKLTDIPCPEPEKSDNDIFGIKCTAALCIPELSDLQ